MLFQVLLATLALATIVGAAQHEGDPPGVLPGKAAAQLEASLEQAAAHARHIWRDTPATNADGTISAYIEISRGDRRKWELDMAANARAIDRMIPEALGGYPVNYGFVPQTVSYDGDPFDALVLGPPLDGGAIVRGLVVGLMHMEDEKGLDSKVVLSPAGPDGLPLHRLTTDEQQRIADYFRRYKLHQAGAYSKVPGWGSAADGASFVSRTHSFFLHCRGRSGQPCAMK
jgi:inorganic pyrophosphatase